MRSPSAVKLYLVPLSYCSKQWYFTAGSSGLYANELLTKLLDENVVVTAINKLITIRAVLVFDNIEQYFDRNIKNITTQLHFFM